MPRKQKPKPDPIDLDFRNEGSIVMVTPRTDGARAWLDAHTETEPWQWFGMSLAVDLRYAEDLLFGAQSDGLALAMGGRPCRLGAS